MSILFEKHFPVEFNNEERSIRIRRTRIGCVLTLVLMPLGISLDYAGYPDSFSQILIARVVCEVIVLAIFLLLFTGFWKKNIVFLSTLWGIAPAFSISWMIYVTEGSYSPYYAGLNLVILGTCILLPYRILEATLYCSVVLISYVIACLFHTKSAFIAPAFTSNTIFIVMTSAICITSSHFYSVSRFNDFLLRQTLREKNEQLTQLDRAKSDFFANVSHELRTPLTTILAPLEDILSPPNTLSTKVSNSLRLVQNSAVRLLRLIDDLLELVRFEVGKSTFEKEVIQLNLLAESLVESVSVVSMQKNINISFNSTKEDISINGDIQAIEKVIINLLSNAIKFTPPNGNIEVKCWEDNKCAFLEVSDTGIGISLEEQKHVFNRFHQVDGTATRKHQGLGIGLALAKELVEAHDGQIHISSELGVGSKFITKFPLYKVFNINKNITEATNRFIKTKPESSYLVSDLTETENTITNQVLQLDNQEISKSSLPVKTENRNKATVLIIDDEPGVRQLLVSILSPKYKLFEASDGETGLQLAKKTSPNVVIVDMMMPGKSGLSVSKELRANKKTSDCKIIMVTARVDEKLKVDALNNSIDDFLTKPFSTAEVKARVDNLSETTELQRFLQEKNDELQATLLQLRETEGQLIQSEKMNAIGSLSAGLLHEINNPLNHTLMAVNYAKTLITDQIQKKQESHSEYQEIEESLDDVEVGMNRISDIITDLRTFAYPEESKNKNNFSLKGAINTALQFTSHLLSGVDVKIQVDEQLSIHGLKTQITQVFVNLFQNAAYAVQSISPNRNPSISITGELKKDRIFVSVKDNGNGIEPQNIERLFEPFFTTKDVGEGIGLGLCVCRTIISSHGGTISVNSEFGMWTIISFDLPISEVRDEY